MTASKTSFIYIAHLTSLLDVQIILLGYHLDGDLAETGATSPTFRWCWMHVSPHNKWGRLEAGDWQSDGMLGWCSDMTLIQGRPRQGTHKNPSCTSTTGVTRNTCCVHTSAGTSFAWQLDRDINAPLIYCSPSHTWRKKIISLILFIKHGEWRKMPDWVDFENWESWIQVLRGIS